MVNWFILSNKRFAMNPKPLTIQPAKENQLLEVLYIIRECAEQLIAKGLTSWHNTHDDYAAISLDIRSKYVYLVFIGRIPVGTITIKPDASDATVSYLDRLAIFPHYQGRGLAKEMIDFAEAHSRGLGFKMLRGIIPIDDDSLCKLLDKKGFINMGVAPSDSEEFVRMIFEKRLG